MSLKVYPTLPGLTFPVLRMAEFNTLKQSAPNKYDVRIPQTVNPFWHWELIYDFLRDFPYASFSISELRTLLDFYLYQGGQAGEFLYLDPDDNYVGPAMVASSPNTLAELPLVNDGAGNYYSPLQRTLGGLFFEDITDLNTNTGAGGSTPAIYANGTLATGGTGAGEYQIQGPGLAIPGASYMGMYLKWGAGAPPTAPITAQFNFYFRVHFESDQQDMEKFSNQLWTIGGSETKNGTGYIKLETSRPNPL